MVSTNCNYVGFVCCRWWQKIRGREVIVSMGTFCFLRACARVCLKILHNLTVFHKVEVWATGRRILFTATRRSVITLALLGPAFLSWKMGLYPRLWRYMRLLLAVESHPNVFQHWDGPQWWQAWFCQWCSPLQKLLLNQGNNQHSVHISPTICSPYNQQVLPLRY